MMDKKLREAIELLGGKAVVVDQDKYYILLTLKEFKKMRQESVEGLTKQELVDKINNDIASWKSSQEEKKLEEVDLAELGTVASSEIHYERA